MTTQNTPTTPFPKVEFQRLEAADRIRVEELLLTVLDQLMGLFCDRHDGSLSLEQVDTLLQNLQQDMTDQHGELGRIAFQDAVRLARWSLDRHSTLRGLRSALDKAPSIHPPIRDPEL